MANKKVATFISMSFRKIEFLANFVDPCQFLNEIRRSYEFVWRYVQIFDSFWTFL